MTGKPDYEPAKDEVFGGLNRLNRLIKDLDDRALALSLAAFAEEALGDLIRAFLIPGEAVDRLLEGFNSPLGTLSARIKMAFSLGLITQHQFDDLERLRKIRNAFAHTWDAISFSDGSISSHIKAINFHSLDDDYPQNDAEKLRTSIGLLLTEIKSNAHQIRKLRQGAKILARHLISGVPGELDDQIALCRSRLTDIQSELHHAKGDRRRYLLAAKHRWEGKLEIVRLNSPPNRRAEVVAVQVELKAWAREPEY